MTESHLTTYRMADGSLVYGDYAFVTDVDFFDDGDQPFKVVSETWRIEDRRIQWMPMPLCCECEAEIGDTVGIDKDDPPKFCSDACREAWDQ